MILVVVSKACLDSKHDTNPRCSILQMNCMNTLVRKCRTFLPLIIHTFLYLHMFTLQVKTNPASRELGCKSDELAALRADSILPS